MTRTADALMGLKVLLLLALFAAPREFEGKVSAVKDGDTIVVGAVVVRLWASDCPEIKHNSKQTDQPYGPEAKRFTERLVVGQKVLCKVKGSSYGRTVAEVLIDGKSVNAGLVKAGLAQVDDRYVKGEARAVFLSLQTEAKGAARGLWSDSHPIRPRDWRKGDR